MIIAVVLLTLFYLYNVRNFRYWRDRGVKHDTPVAFFGTNFRQFALRTSMVDIITEHYRKYPGERYVGYFMANDPLLILRDPELIRHVLLADCATFGRGMNINPDAPEPMYRNLIFADGDLWKLLRQRMAPAYTANKLKGMFPYIERKTRKLQEVVERISKQRAEIDIRELQMRFMTDVSGSYHFGFEVDSLNFEDCPYRKLSRRMFSVTKREAIIVMLKMAFPKLCANLEVICPKTKRAFLSVFRKAASARNYKPSGCNDFIDLLLEMKQKGPMVGESIETLREDGTPQRVEIEFDDILMASQIFQFFGAGVESSASAASYTLHQLAYHPEIQHKCQEEVDNVLARHNNRVSFEAINEMTLLAMTLKEALRLFPSTGIFIRMAYRTYTLPGTNITIDPGVRIVVPVQALQNDERHFEAPEEFRPERFQENKLGDIMKRKVYLPFGDGTRNCIGERLATAQTLAGIASVLRRCTVRPGRTTVRRPPLDPSTTMVQNFTNGLPLLLEPRDNGAGEVSSEERKL